jgi:hypothetical protein
MAGVAKRITRQLPNLLTSLITHAGLEAVHAVIHGVKQTARGFPVRRACGGGRASLSLITGTRGILNRPRREGMPPVA